MHEARALRSAGCQSVPRHPRAEAGSRLKVRWMAERRTYTAGDILQLRWRPECLQLPVGHGIPGPLLRALAASPSREVVLAERRTYTACDILQLRWRPECLQLPVGHGIPGCLLRTLDASPSREAVLAAVRPHAERVALLLLGRSVEVRGEIWRAAPCRRPVSSPLPLPFGDWALCCGVLAAGSRCGKAPCPSWTGTATVSWGRRARWKARQSCRCGAAAAAGGAVGRDGARMLLRGPTMRVESRVGLGLFFLPL